ncbi:MAG TPA: 2-oxoacid:ferredoxin oxidoreductase subunit beta, partial [Pedomonas sp.]
LALEVVTLGEDGLTEADVLVHDETNRMIAHLLVEMAFPEFPVALGVIYCDPAPTYEAAIAEQTQALAASRGVADFDALLRRGQTWTVS